MKKHCYLRPAFAIYLLVLQGCGAWEVERTIAMDSPVQSVWDILVDLEKYPDWNTYSRSAVGTLEVGGMVRIEAQLGDEVRHVDNVVLELAPPSTLCWQSQNWFRFLVRGTRCRYLEAGGAGGTMFRHHEIMEGVLAGLVEWIYRPRVEKGLAQMNNDLKSRAETIAPLSR